MALAIFLLAACLVAQAAEQTVTFTVEGMKVVGTLNLPEGVEKPPVALLLHSFGGSRDEVKIPAVNEGIFARAARIWADQGIASLRIDYRFAGGASDGNSADATLDAHVADGLAALDYLANSGRVDANRMVLVGWSMGGAVSTAVAARTPHKLDAVALWNPAINMPASFPLLWGAEKIKEALASGDKPVELPMPQGQPLKVKSAFFVSLLTLVPAAEIANYDGPLFVAVGTQDNIVFPQPALGESLIRYHHGEGELFVRPMDHFFNAFQNEKLVDELILATGSFIVKNARCKAPESC